MTPGVLFSIALLAYPFLMALFLNYNREHLNSLESRKKYENFYKDVHIKIRGRKAIYYYPQFLTKRWLIIMISVLMGRNSGLQFIFLLNVNKASIIIYGKMMSHNTRERRRLEFFNDFLVMWISYAMVCMTDFVQDEMVKYYMGYVEIALFGIVVLGDLSYISNLIYQLLAWKHRMA